MLNYYLFLNDVCVLLHCFNDVCSYISLQEEISVCFEYMKTFLTDKVFIEHVQPDKKERKRILEELDRNILDLKRIDCSIVFAGKIAIFILINTEETCFYSQTKGLHTFGGYLGIIALKLTNQCILI